MKIETTSLVSLAPALVRERLRDPAVLEAILPACIGVVVDRAPWVLSFDAAFMGFHERFDVEVGLQAETRASSMRLCFAAMTRLGRASGDGEVCFEPESSGTRVHVYGNMACTGLLFALGEAVLRNAAAEIVRRALKNLEKREGLGALGEP